MTKYESIDIKCIKRYKHFYSFLLICIEKAEKLIFCRDTKRKKIELLIEKIYKINRSTFNSYDTIDSIILTERETNKLSLSF